MPSLNNNEKRLLTVFGVAIFIVANVFGYLFVSAQMKALEGREKQLKDRQSKLTEARDRAAEADAMREWMDNHLERYPSEEAREIYLDGVVNGPLTTGLDVELSKSRTLPTETTEFFVKSRFTTSVKGPWPDVKEFIYRLQKPEVFRFVPRLSMMPKKSEEDDSVQLVEVSLEIEKWWPKPDDFIETPDAVLAGNEQPAADAVKPSTADAPAPPPAPAGDTPAAPAPAAPPAETPNPAVTTPPPDPAPSPDAAPVTPPESNPPKPNTL